jgi:hypothetical protein
MAISRNGIIVLSGVMSGPCAHGGVRSHCSGPHPRRRRACDTPITIALDRTLSAATARHSAEGQADEHDGASPTKPTPAAPSCSGAPPGPMHHRRPSVAGIDHRATNISAAPSKDTIGV